MLLRGPERLFMSISCASFCWRVACIWRNKRSSCVVWLDIDGCAPVRDRSGMLSDGVEMLDRHPVA